MVHTWYYYGHGLRWPRTRTRAGSGRGGGLCRGGQWLVSPPGTQCFAFPSCTAARPRTVTAPRNPSYFVLPLFIFPISPSLTTTSSHLCALRFYRIIHNQACICIKVLETSKNIMRFPGAVAAPTENYRRKSDRSVTYFRGVVFFFFFSSFTRTVTPGERVCIRVRACTKRIKSYKDI